MPQQEDSHFLIDNACPKEVELILRSLRSDEPLSTSQLRACLKSDFGYEAQKNLSFSTRRLVDLGLAKQQILGGKPGYVLTPPGKKVRSVLYERPDLYADVMHFLHYDGDPVRRKLFLSYHWCCEIVWDRKEMADTKVIAAEVQSRIATRYPDMYAQRVGGNFNVGGVDSWKAWIAALSPPPFGAGNPRERKLSPRIRDCYELSLLGLDHVYRQRGYRYGDPVLLDETLLDRIAAVFFLDLTCCRRLLEVAARLTRIVRLADTLAGTAITLLEPYTIERI